jgi:formylglycine-generating enzyme required for sulfatase activity
MVEVPGILLGPEQCRRVHRRRSEPIRQRRGLRTSVRTSPAGSADPPVATDGNYPVGRGTAIILLEAALAVFDPQQAPAITLPDRIAAADALAPAGDPRLDWTHPERWVELHDGRFWMGVQKADEQAKYYDPDASYNEAPVHEVLLGGFLIARFPVTVSEYARFLEDEDHRDPRWWQAGGADEPPEPGDWESQQAHPSRPVVGISWYQAMAFCAWLSERLAGLRGAQDAPLLPAGRRVRLPTEAQWEYVLAAA